MYVLLKCAVVDADSDSGKDICDTLVRLGMFVAGSHRDLTSFTELLKQPDPPQLVIVNLDPNPRKMLQSLAPLIQQFTFTSFFVLSRTVDPRLLMEAMHLGVKEFIPMPIDPEMMLAGIERVATAHRSGKRARIINIIPAVGGSGATTVACNVAVTLAQSAKTAIVDLDMARGSVAVALDIRPRYTIADVMRSVETLDQQLLQNAFAMHQPSGLAILARPESVDESSHIQHAGFGRLLHVLGQMFDYIVIDSVMSLDPFHATAIQVADVNVIVMQLNIPSARNTERFVAALRQMGIDSGKIKIIANRVASREPEIDSAEVERVLGLKIAWTIPNDYKNAIEATNFGKPLVLSAPRAAVSISLRGLAGILDGKTVSHNNHSEALVAVVGK